MSSQRDSYALVNPILFSLGGDARIFNSGERAKSAASFAWMYKDSELCFLRALSNVRVILLKQYRMGLQVPLFPEEYSLDSCFHFPRSTVAVLKENNCDILSSLTTGMVSRFLQLQDRINDQLPYLTECLELGDLLSQKVSELFDLGPITDELSLKLIGEEFCQNLDNYPNRVWVGNGFVTPTLLDSDRAFIDGLFGEDRNAPDQYNPVVLKHQIDTIEGTLSKGKGKCSIAVDTQNVNPSSSFRFIRWLQEQYPEILFSICFYGDGRESVAWQQAELSIGCNVTYHRSAIIRDSKSIVDTDVIAGICTDYYSQNFRSFIVISGDCDFMPLVRFLKDVSICFVGSSQTISAKSVEFLRHNGAGFILMDVFLNQLSMAAENGLLEATRQELMDSLSRVLLNPSSIVEQVMRVARERGCIIDEATAYELLRDLLNSHTILLGSDGFFHLKRVTEEQV